MAARVTAFVVIAIVAVTFVAGLIVGAQKEDDSGPVDLIVYNARVYTGNPDAQFAEAIAIRGNRIWRVGSNREIKRLMRRATTVIDAHGGTVTAGFRDGSVDLKAGGLTLGPAEALPIGGATGSNPGPGAATSPTSSPATASATAAPAAEVGSTSAPAEAGTTALAPETGDTLDAIQQAIGHANTVGVTSVGVTARTPDDLLPYDTLLRTRELTARVNAALAAEWPLDEAAVARLDVLRKRYEGVPLFKLKAVRLMVTDEVAPVGAASKSGKSAKSVTSASAASASGSALAAGSAAAVVAEGDGVSPPSPPGSPAMVPAMEQAAALAINAKAATAAAADRVAALGRTIALLEQHDWQIILETKDAGDAGLALSAIEASRPAAATGGAAAAAGSGATASAKSTTAATAGASRAKAKQRVRLEVSAGTLLDKDTVARLIALDVIASTPKPMVRPALMAAQTRTGASASATTPADASASTGAAPSSVANAEGTDVISPASLEDEALFEALTRPYANLIASAAPFVLYSAWPVTPIDPRFALSLIMLDGVRLTGDDKPKAAADTLAARLARAIDACTRYAAFASGDQEQQGTIAKEMLADLVIFSADLFALPPDKLMDAEVTTTIFDGKVIYTRPEPTTDTASSQ
jgi:predicted amidohydrolase YtcJ